MLTMLTKKDGIATEIQFNCMIGENTEAISEEESSFEVRKPISDEVQLGNKQWTRRYLDGFQENYMATAGKEQFRSKLVLGRLIYTNDKQ